METISSDTSVWIDFITINAIELPFLLDCIYVMYSEAILDELCSPVGLGSQLVDFGLIPVDLTIEEFEEAERYGNLYPRLSIYDRIALAIAKRREITLLTGDGALRKAAANEKVNVMGTLGILDRLLENQHIDNTKYMDCLNDLALFYGLKIRLPTHEINIRIEKIKSQSK